MKEYNNQRHNPIEQIYAKGIQMELKDYYKSLRKFNETLRVEEEPNYQPKARSERQHDNQRQEYATGGNVKRRSRFPGGGDVESKDPGPLPPPGYVQPPLARAPQRNRVRGLTGNPNFEGMYEGMNKPPYTPPVVTPTYQSKYLGGLNLHFGPLQEGENPDVAIRNKALKMAVQRGNSGNPSTFVMMNRAGMKDLKRFIKDPESQEILDPDISSGFTGGILTYPISQNPTHITRAATVYPGGNPFIHQNPTGWRISSVGSKQYNKGVRLPSHHVQVVGGQEIAIPKPTSGPGISKRVKLS